VIQNPPNYYIENAELDKVYELDYEYEPHPIYNHQIIKATQTTKFSITTHRGCFGECNFCAIGVHFGRRVRSRSAGSIIKEVSKFFNKKEFKGNINDLGGATSNMYMMECSIQKQNGSCKGKRCLFPKVCSSMNISHANFLQLIKKVRLVRGINKVFINSGIRYDLVECDKKGGLEFLEYVVENCVSGQMKIAPEHFDKEVLIEMGKPAANLHKFVEEFYRITKKQKRKQYLTYYLMAGHPVKVKKDRVQIKNEVQLLKNYFFRHYGTSPEQIQLFTPTPSTYSSLVFYLEKRMK